MKKYTTIIYSRQFWYLQNNLILTPSASFCAGCALLLAASDAANSSAYLIDTTRISNFCMNMKEIISNALVKTHEMEISYGLDCSSLRH